jgi:electron transfer flavoprotein alpha subunit
MPFRVVVPAIPALLRPSAERHGDKSSSSPMANRDLRHSREIGITGRAIAPRLHVALGISGKFNHTVGVQRAATVVAVNSAALHGGHGG